MKKLNRKQIKLKYIREKNHYRNGGDGKYFLKLFYKPKDEELKEIIDNYITRINKKYKMNFKYFDLETGCIDDSKKYILYVKFKFKAL